MKTINSFRSKLFALTLAIVASVSAFAYEFEYVNDFHIDGFAYKILPSNTMYPYGSAALVEIADCTKDVVIPEFVSNGNSEFRIETFGIGSVVFTNEASSIVESITIPKTIKIINKNVLAGCPNLKTVIVDSENPYYDSRESCNAIITTSQNPYFTPNTLIAGCKTTIIPNSVAEIGDNAFYNCESLDIITIPSSVSKIGNSAFNACSSLSSIILSENLTAIGDWAFADCNNLSEVVCYALQPPTISKYTFPGFVPWVYVPTESIERYKAASEWKKLLICDISWFEACNEYKHVKLSVIPYSNKLIYSLVTDDGSEIPDVDSVWILNTDKEPLQKFYGQSRDTIDLLFLELGTYILEVYLNECVKSRTFVHRPKMKYIWCDTWNVMWFDGMRFDETASTSQYRLGKDTIIGDYTYSKFTSRTSVRFTSDRKVYVYYEGFDDNDPYTPDLPTGEYLAYDFSAQVGDTLEVFSGIGTYSTYLCVVDDVETAPSPCVVDDVQADLKTFPLIIKLRPLCDVDGEGNMEISSQEITWIEGVGSPEGFLISSLPCGWVGGGTYALLCAYKGDELKYTGPLYEEYGCEYNATEQKPEDLFPTLWGLQRTTFYHYTDCSESASSLTVSNEIVTINDKPYLRFGDLFIREENNRVLIYSEAYDKDLVLYDWNLEVGDSVTLLAFDFGFYPEDAASVVDYRVIVDIDDNGDLVMDTIPTDKVVVDKVSTITLLDGKEYKMWHLATGWAGGITYVEGIGIFGEGYFEGDYFGLIQIEELPACYYGDLLVCITRNGQLLYQMDDTEMERLGAECLCDYDNGPRKDNAKNGKIGGRPTPTQWNMLEVDLREMEHGNTILRAETFSYTLENDSIVTNGKTFYQLARQSTKDTATTKSFVGALHFGEDEDNRVYFFRDGHEYVLYDFTAEPGDTLEIFAGINNYPQDSTYTHVVIGKDTIENGACRMTLEVVFPNQTSGYDLQKVWLAGLGSIDGIVHNAAKRTSDTHAAPSRSAHNSDTQTSIMLCAWRDDNCLYTTDHPDYGTYGCVYNQESTSIEDIHTSPSYQKFIRDGQLFILYNGNIYNVMGVELK